MNEPIEFEPIEWEEHLKSIEVPLPVRTRIDWERYAELPVPASLEAWTLEVIIASFPADDVQEIYFHTLQYIGWMNQLPAVEVLR